MPRKRKESGGNAATAEAEVQSVTASSTDNARPAYIDGPPVAEDGRVIAPANPEAKNWGDPYKAIFTSSDKGFELGEDRRFKQRVFRFSEKPADDVLAVLKDAGFTYRASEKAWTIPATPESRRVSEELAWQFAGKEEARGR